MTPTLWTLLLCLRPLVRGYNNGVGSRPALAWNTWCSIENCGQGICNEVEIQEVAQAMRSNGMYDAGYTRINMDDCWEASERGPNGEIQPNPQRFPSGLKSLAATLHGYGFKFGLYTSAGSTTCRGQPGSIGHYTADAQTFASWDMDYVKLDWCGGNLTNSTQQHTEFSEALNATGREIWFELLSRFFPDSSYYNIVFIFQMSRVQPPAAGVRGAGVEQLAHHGGPPRRVVVDSEGDRDERGQHGHVWALQLGV